MSRPDPQELEDRAKVVSHLLTAHGGGVEVVSCSEDGVVRIRFNGLCTACCLKPLTTANYVRPLFEDIDGVTAVEIDGARVSDEALARLAS